MKMLTDLYNTDWWTFFESEEKEDYFKNLMSFVESEYNSNLIFPPKDKVFNAFMLTSFKNTKVVILGQDPYHGENQANGLSFSVEEGQKLPPSLKNIFKELQSDLDIYNQHSGNLESWAEQGVLLLNATLTVQAKKPGSHQNKGWETFTDVVIKELSENKDHLVFILWGAYAQKKGQHIDRTKHLVIESAHPSPFSVYRGFFGSKPFSSTNEYLVKYGNNPIDWGIKTRDLFNL